MFAIIRREVFKISNVVKVKHRAKWIACVQKGKGAYNNVITRCCMQLMSRLSICDIENARQLKLASNHTTSIDNREIKSVILIN